MSNVLVSIIKPIQWHPMEQLSLSKSVASWLMEQGSMTQRFEQHCDHVHVEPQQTCFIHHDQLGDDAKHLPINQRYWLREIILFGDGIPWLLGRTIIPEGTLSGPEQALINLGTVPLGRYLFNNSNHELTRDFIQIGLQDDLWARRSLLRLSNKPLLLTEVFLPASPIYQATKI